MDSIPAANGSNSSTKPAVPARNRRVRPQDEAAMARFVDRLGADSRRLRFHGSVGRCSAALARRLCTADGQRHQAWVAVTGAAAAEEIIGEARLAIGDEGSAELAIVVADAWQGRGVAQGLLQELQRAAVQAQARRLFGEVLDTNERMQAFLRRNGFELDPFATGDTLRMQRLLPTPRTVAARWWQGLAQRLAPRWLRPVLG